MKRPSFYHILSKYIGRRELILAAVLILIVAAAALLILRETPAIGVYPTLDNYWDGHADWLLEIPDTGLPMGESDTIIMDNGEWWSYLHASTQSAGITDSCGDPVEFPGCVTRWVSTDQGRTFTISEPTCLFECDSCPCDAEDMTRQQQYPRVVRGSGGTFHMVFEHGAAAWITRSGDGLDWDRPKMVPYTGVWVPEQGHCPIPEQTINDHPFAAPDPDDCMVGGPPGIVLADSRVYVLLGFGQSPGHLGCYRAINLPMLFFDPCATDVLLSGSRVYGPPDALGADANPYFDFRYITSAEVVRVERMSGEMYYMVYEGIRGPDSTLVGGDTQFALGMARSKRIDAAWEAYPGNPILGDVGDNVGVGHADIVIDGGITYLYTATPDGVRGRYVLVVGGE